MTNKELKAISNLGFLEETSKTFGHSTFLIHENEELYQYAVEVGYEVKTEGKHQWAEKKGITIFKPQVEDEEDESWKKDMPKLNPGTYSGPIRNDGPTFTPHGDDDGATDV